MNSVITQTELNDYDFELQMAIWNKYKSNKQVTTTYSEEDDRKLQLSIWNKYKSVNPTKSKEDNDLIKFHLKEINQDVYLNEEESYGYKSNEIDTTDLHNKQELISYLKWHKMEDNTIELSKDKLKTLDIQIKERSKGRFAHYDCVATSANTETIYIEYKNRPDINSDTYDSVIIDGAKYKALLDLYLRTKKNIYIIYTYKDGKIRVFDFVKSRSEYNQIKEIEVKDNVYSDRKRSKVYIYYPNELSILL